MKQLVNSVLALEILTSRRRTHPFLHGMHNPSKLYRGTFSKYQPHQSTREINRRLARKV